MLRRSKSLNAALATKATEALQPLPRRRPNYHAWRLRFPSGALADISNSGTLFASVMVTAAVLVLRRTKLECPPPIRHPGRQARNASGNMSSVLPLFSLAPYSPPVCPLRSCRAGGLLTYRAPSRERGLVNCPKPSPKRPSSLWLHSGAEATQSTNRRDKHADH